MKNGMWREMRKTYIGVLLLAAAGVLLASGALAWFWLDGQMPRRQPARARQVWLFYGDQSPDGPKMG